MIFGFKEVARTTFKRNFLRSVVFQLDFPNIQFQKKQTEDLFKLRFPRMGIVHGGSFTLAIEKSKPIVQHNLDNDMLEMRSQNGLRIVSVSSNNISFRIDANEYKSFDDFRQELEIINRFFADNRIESVIKISIRKVNIIGVKNTDNSLSSSYTVFQDDLIKSLSVYPKEEYVKQGLISTNLINGQYALNIKYGLNFTENPVSQAIIDLQISSSEKTEIENVFTGADKLNQEIFNAFMWIMNEKFTTVLSNG